MDNYISINLIYLRNKQFLNRIEFAKKLGVSYGSLSSYEQAKALPPITFIQLSVIDFLYF